MSPHCGNLWISRPKNLEWTLSQDGTQILAANLRGYVIAWTAERFIRGVLAYEQAVLAIKVMGTDSASVIDFNGDTTTLTDLLTGCGKKTYGRLQASERSPKMDRFSEHHWPNEKTDRWLMLTRRQTP